MSLLDVLTPSAGWATAVLIAEYLVKIIALGTVPANRQPASSQSWLLAILLIPVIGVPLFLMFGSPYVRGRRHRIQEEANLLFSEKLSQWPTVPAGSRPSVGVESVLNMNRALTSLPCATGKFQAIRSDYADSLHAMTEAVRTATTTIYVEFYAQSWDEETDAFYTELVAAAKRGVQVRLLVDQLGSLRYRGFRVLRRRLRGTGIQWRLMLPINPLAGRFRRPDLRNHRKLMVVDSAVAFTGSQNLISRFYGSRRNKKVGREWHDVMIEVRGDVVSALEGIFAVDWYTESGEILPILRAAVVPTEQEHALGQQDNVFQVVPSGPGYRTEPNMRMFTELAGQATQRLRIVSPYFVPSVGLLDAITSAAYRGVRVELYVPSEADQFWVQHAQQSYFRELLESGVRIFRYPAPAVLHTKMFLVDGRVGVVGSSNMDMRSFSLNFEISVLVFGGHAVDELEEVVDEYLHNCTELDLASWESRGWIGRYVDNVARLTSALQ